jgi:hypothetical protein
MRVSCTYRFACIGSPGIRALDKPFNLVAGFLRNHPRRARQSAAIARVWRPCWSAKHPRVAGPLRGVSVGKQDGAETGDVCAELHVAVGSDD